MRATIFIAPSGAVKHYALYDPSTGRNVEECLRVLDALQHAEKYGEVCPVNWKKGEGTVLEFF